MSECIFLHTSVDDLNIKSGDSSLDIKIKERINCRLKDEFSFYEKSKLFSESTSVYVNTKIEKNEIFIAITPSFNRFSGILKNLDGFYAEIDLDFNLFEVYSIKEELINSGGVASLFDKGTNPLMIHPRDFEIYEYQLSNLIKGKPIKKTTYFRSKILNNKYNYYIISTYTNDDGRVKILFKNVNSAAKEKAELVEASSHDMLTGILNKKAITQMAIERLESNSNQKYAIGIIDLDYFKNIDDTYGHLFGDFVLQQFSKTLEGQIGSQGAVGRIGGDEFLFILKINDDRDEAIKPIMRKIKYSAKNLVFEENKNFRLSTTIGVATYPKNGKKFDELFQKADIALYRGKMKGKDCYIIFNEILHGNLKKNGDYKNHANSVSRKMTNSNFMSICLDKLLNSSDIKETLEEVLIGMAKHFKLDRVILSDANLNIIDSYDATSSKRVTKMYDAVLDPEYLDLFNSDNVLACSEIGVIAQQSQKYSGYYTEYGIRSLVQILLTTQDKNVGFMSIELHNERRAWQADELLYFKIISKLFAAFIVKYNTELTLQKISSLDPITGLSNYSTFKNALQSDKYEFINGAFLSIDISKFKYVNDNYGYKKGDEFLKEIGEKIRTVLPSDTLLCRVYDDKFLSYTDYVSKSDLFDIFTKVREAIEDFGKQNNVFLSVSGGASMVMHESKDNLENLIDKAVSARKYAKDNMSLDLIIFDDKIFDNDDVARNIERRMVKALKEREFEVYLQPCYNLHTNQVSSFEALIRWNNQGNLLLPGAFIPIFERNGFVLTVDFFVYEEVCKTLKSWKDQGYELKRISVNVSRGHVHDEFFIAKLNNILNKYGIEKKYFCLEITESLFIDDQNGISKFVKNLHDEGYTIYMDDFGVAYSTLNLLAKMQVDLIKLDRGFISENFKNDKEYIITRNVIKMAKELGMTVLSEGIETEHQIEELKALDCDYAQGFYYARPEPLKNIEVKYLKKLK